MPIPEINPQHPTDILDNQDIDALREYGKTEGPRR